MVVKPVHCGSSSILKVRFLGHPVYLMGSYSSSNYCSGVPDLAKEWLGTGEAERCPGGEKGKQSKLHQTLFVYIL